MKVIPQFCSPSELQDLERIWRAGRGWSARGAYTFVPCINPPIVLVQRALAYMPASAKVVSSFFLHYLPGQSVGPHVDARSLSRLNVLVIRPEEGGMFQIGNSPVVMELGDAVVFNPCEEPHSVLRIDKGERLVWSVGQSVSDIYTDEVLTRKVRAGTNPGSKPRS